jgi:XTP/dITP diphosphohydrolase
MSQKLVFATHNAHKLHEIQMLLPESIQLVSLDDIGCVKDIPETSDTLEGNAEQKARYVFQTFQVPCFADDTGLLVDALGGEPGVRSARYAGDGRNAEDNMSLVLHRMEGKTNRSARFITSICFIDGTSKYFFEGRVEGEILEGKSGNQGFGYDPIFRPKGFVKSFAEMSMEEKNSISHRARAVAELVGFLTEKWIIS